MNWSRGAGDCKDGGSSACVNKHRKPAAARTRSALATGVRAARGRSVQLLPSLSACIARWERCILIPRDDDLHFFVLAAASLISAIKSLSCVNHAPAYFPFTWWCSQPVFCLHFLYMYDVSAFEWNKSYESHTSEELVDGSRWCVNLEMQSASNICSRICFPASSMHPCLT